MLSAMDESARRRRRRTVAVAFALSLLTAPLLAAPASSTPVQSVFHIAKSENRNEVHYAVRVDAACRPVGAQPIYGYWHEFEKGPQVVSPLLEHEQPAYGLTPPREIQRSDAGGQIKVSLRAFPDRPLVVATGRQNNRCGARAYVLIQKGPAMLESIYVKIGFLFSVDYAITRGLRVPDGAPVQEKMHD
jgi:hypothetical protein